MESLWERSRHAFERILEDSRKASERMVEVVGDLGDRARAHLEKARVQRALFKRSAELGGRIWELTRPPAPGTPRSSAGSPLENPAVVDLLGELTQLDQELKKLEAQLAAARA